MNATTSCSPQEHDTVHLELSAALYQAQHKLVSSHRWTIGAAFGLRANQTITEALEALDAEPLRYSIGYRNTNGEIAQKYRDAAAAVVAATEAREAHEDGYTSWQRYFLVVSSAGLIHANTYCSTCHKGKQATEFALLPTLSGLYMTEAVRALGPILCSVCFPAAPAQWVDDKSERIPTRITELLLGKGGVDAFNAELSKYRAKKMNRDTKGRG